MIPNWQDTLTVAHERRSLTLTLDGKTIRVKVIGNTSLAIVCTPHEGRDLRIGDVIWLRKMTADGKTTIDPQFFKEGFFGAARGLERVAKVESGKAEALNRSATLLTTSLAQLMQARDDRELEPLFQPHILLLELFASVEPDKVEQLRRGNPRRIQAMLRDCLVLHDITGRENRGSKWLKGKGSQKQLKFMSNERMTTANAALTTSVTLNALMYAMHRLVAEAKMEIESKLNASTWDLNNFRHRKWLKRFADKLVEWADEFDNIDMYPLHKDARRVSTLLREVSEEILDALQRRLENRLNTAKLKLRLTVEILREMEARFQIADALRVVGTARDERVQMLGLAIQQPAWDQIEACITHARETLGIEKPTWAPIHSLVEDPRLTHAYAALRDAAERYDNKARAAV